MFYRYIYKHSLDSTCNFSFLVSKCPGLVDLPENRKNLPPFQLLFLYLIHIHQNWLVENFHNIHHNYRSLGNYIHRHMAPWMDTCMEQHSKVVVDNTLVVVVLLDKMLVVVRNTLVLRDAPYVVVLCACLPFAPLDAKTYILL